MRSTSQRVGERVAVRWRDHASGVDQDGAGDGAGPAGPDLRLVARLVPPGDGDLRRRGAGVLEASARRLGAALLLALHRDGRRLHGGLSLDGDRRRAAVDLSVRGVRGVRAGGQPSFLPGLPARRTRSSLRYRRAGPGGALRDARRSTCWRSGGACAGRGWLGSHAAGDARRARAAAGPSAGAGLHRPGGR